MTIDIKYIDINSLRSSYDFIVIGAGVSGSIVASRLATHSSHPYVLLLEAGDKADTSQLSIQIIPAFLQANHLTYGNKIQSIYFNINYYALHIKMH